jgi:hypothetical protein
VHTRVGFGGPAFDPCAAGPSFQLDSTKPIRVVTQFITNDGTATGDLVEMRRFYIQDNKTIHNPTPSYAGEGTKEYTSISDEMCAAQMTNFSDRLDVFQGKGGVKGMGEAMKRGMALVFSLWDDQEVGMIVRAHALASAGPQHAARRGARFAPALSDLPLSLALAARSPFLLSRATRALPMPPETICRSRTELAPRPRSLLHTFAQWLDATDPYPSHGQPGAKRGTCSQTSGNATFVEK